MQRDRMMGKAWQDQQRAKKAKKERKRSPGVSIQSKFDQVEAEVENLKELLSTGKLTEEQFVDRLASLMFQDERGTWWMVGAETGGWYYYDGANWVPGAPSGNLSISAEDSKGMSHGDKPASLRGRLSSMWNAFWTFVIGLAVVGIFGFVAGSLVAEIENQYWPFIASGAIWVGGFILVTREARKKWYGG
jgi:hypothetical protein